MSKGIAAFARVAGPDMGLGDTKKFQMMSFLSVDSGAEIRLGPGGF